MHAQALREFFVNESADPKGMTPEEYQEHVQDMEALFENDREALLEHTNGASIAPILPLWEIGRKRENIHHL